MSSRPLFERGAGKVSGEPAWTTKPRRRALRSGPPPETVTPRRAACFAVAARTCEGHQPKAAAIGASPRHLELINDLHGPHLRGVRCRRMHGL